MPQKISGTNAVYWGTFLFAAITTTYLLVHLINLSTEEDTAFLSASNYRSQVRFVTVATSLGSFKVTFLRKEAPRTVKNFLRLAQSGFYDQTKFSYFSEGVFMENDLVPGSSTPTGGIIPLWGESIEATQMMRGLVAMPRREGNRIDGRQVLFFSEDDPSSPSEEYAAFGRVVEGMEMVEKVREASLGVTAAPHAPVSIISVSVD